MATWVIFYVEWHVACSCVCVCVCVCVYVRMYLYINLCNGENN